MPDKEKVIRALDCLSRNAQDGACAGCAYFKPFTDDPDTGWCDSKTAMADALVLIKEQETKKGHWILDPDGMDWGQPSIIRCKECRHRDPDDGRCDCGHDIRWNLPRPDDWFCSDGEKREILGEEKTNNV